MCFSCSPWVSLGVGSRPVKVLPNCGYSDKSRLGHKAVNSGAGQSSRHDGYTATEGYSETWLLSQHDAVHLQLIKPASYNKSRQVWCRFQAQAMDQVPGRVSPLYTGTWAKNTEQTLHSTSQASPLPSLLHRLGWNVEQTSHTLFPEIVYMSTALGSRSCISRSLFPLSPLSDPENTHSLLHSRLASHAFPEPLPPVAPPTPGKAEGRG